MIDTPTIRTLAADGWRVYKELRLRALADAPDAFGRTLAEEAGCLDAEWSRRLAAGADSRWNLPLVAQVCGQPIGLAWGRIETSDPDVAALHQMWVAASYRRLGAGHMLLEAVIAWARAQRVTPWTWVSRVVRVPRGVSASVLASSPWESPNHSGQDRSCWGNQCDLH